MHNEEDPEQSNKKGKKLKIELSYDPATPVLGLYISRENHNSKSYMHPSVDCSTVDRTGKETKCLLSEE